MLNSEQFIKLFWDLRSRVVQPPPPNTLWHFKTIELIETDDWSEALITETPGADPLQTIGWNIWKGFENEKFYFREGGPSLWWSLMRSCLAGELERKDSLNSLHAYQTRITGQSWWVSKSCCFGNCNSCRFERATEHGLHIFSLTNDILIAYNSSTAVNKTMTNSVNVTWWWSKASFPKVGGTSPMGAVVCYWGVVARTKKLACDY